MGTSQLFLEKSGEKFQFQHLFKEFSGIVPIELSCFIVFLKKMKVIKGTIK